MHLPTAGHFSLADHGNTVFGLARDHTSVATNAGAHIDGHAPGVTFVFEAGVERAFRLVVMLVLPQLRVLPMLLQGRRPHKIAPFHAGMELCAGKHILCPDFTDLHSGSKAGGVCSPNGIGIEAGAVTDLPCMRPAIAEMQCHALVCMAWHDPRRNSQGSPFVAKLDHVGKYSSVFSASRAHSIGQTEALGGFWTHESGIVPGKLDQGLRQLLQPTVVGKAAVEKSRVRLKSNFQGVPSLRLCVTGFGLDVFRCQVSGFRGGRAGTAAYIHIGKWLELHGLRLEARSCDDPIMQCRAPKRLKITGDLLGLP